MSTTTSSSVSLHKGDGSDGFQAHPAYGAQLPQEHHKSEAPPGYDDDDDEGEEEADSEANYKPRTIKFWTIMLGMYLSVFIVALDRTIVATAIPEITNDFNSLQDVGWYASAYMLTAASSSLVFGKIYKYYSVKWVFLESILVFEIGSAICGAAPNSVALIIGRAIAGLGSSGIFMGGIMIIVPLIPLRKRPVYYSLFGAVFGISSVLGPLIGGAFTDDVSWRWCFYINLPIGAFTALAMIFFFHVDAPKSKGLTPLQELNRLDPIGTVLFISSIVCLVLALQWGGTTSAWNAPKIVGLLVAFCVLFLSFWLIQIFKPDTATVPVRIITQRSIAGGALFLFMLTGSLMVVVYYLPIWLQAVKGDTAVHSGISLFPLVISLVVMSILAGGFTQRVGYYMPPMLASPILTSTGAGLLYTITPTSSHSKWIGYQAIYGFGTGMAMQTSSLAAQAVLPRSDISTGMAVNFFAQQLGGAIFVPVAQHVFSSGIASQLSGVTGFDHRVLAETGATDLAKVVPAQEMPAVVNAFNYGVTRAFLVAMALSAGTFLAALIMEWKDIRKVAGERKRKQDAVEDVEQDASEDYALNFRDTGRDISENDFTKDAKNDATETGTVDGLDRDAARNYITTLSFLEQHPAESDPAEGDAATNKTVDEAEKHPADRGDVSPLEYTQRKRLTASHEVGIVSPLSSSRLPTWTE